MKHHRIPPGQYRARVTRRVSRDQSPGSVSVELTFQLATGPHSGCMVSGRFRSRSLVERGRSLHEGQTVVVDVVSRQSGRGRSFSLVRDFRPAGQPTVVSYVDGSCPNDPTNKRLVRQEFGPACLFTKRDVPEIQRARSEYADEGRELPPIPVLEDATLAGIDFDILDPGSAAAPEDEDGPAAPSPLARQAAAFAEEYRWSMLVSGGKAGHRLLVDADEEFARFCRVDAGLDPARPAHLSIYQYSDDLPLYQKAHGGSVAQYRGVVWSRWFVLDLDGEAGLSDRLDAGRILVKALLRLSVAPDRLMIFFSGGRGLHVMFPTDIAHTVPQTNYESACGHFCQVIIDRAVRLLATTDTKQARDCRNDPAWHEALDWCMYKPNAMLRAPNTRHETTGLYKVRVEIDELMTLDADGIERLAKEPRPFEPAAWACTSYATLCELWRYAVQVAASRDFAMPQSERIGDWVFADTFDFMHSGAPAGTRAQRLFRAAVNLLQVGCSREAVYQLLSPAALMSGLASSAVKQQIDGACRYLRKRLVERPAVFLAENDDSAAAYQPTES